MTHLQNVRCCLCDKVAHYIVGTKGYCAAHKSEAFSAGKQQRVSRSPKLAEQVKA